MYDSPSDTAGLHFDQMRRGEEFTITEQHLKLLQRAYITWEYVEFGAPAIDGKRPYGNSDVLRDIAEIVGEMPVQESHEDEDDFYDRRAAWIEDHEQNLAKLHGEMGVALQIVLATGRFEPGDYVKGEKYDATSWMRVGGS